MEYGLYSILHSHFLTQPKIQCRIQIFTSYLVYVGGKGESLSGIVVKVNAAYIHTRTKRSRNNEAHNHILSTEIYNSRQFVCLRAVLVDRAFDLL